MSLTLNDWAMFMGYGVMFATGVIAVSALVIGAVVLFNRATWRLVECYGSIKTSKKFRDWYWQQPENRKGPRDAP